ncbi:HD domain-containing protein [Dyadobacter sp. NIV53]|uniref:HD domain-containing protein n=1 Tax=Dyadobacter sp. NIV53 TaxID=2861765 RepID=UPI001C86B861|nr:HD domain-containing protein [Dyadobacter sp. NIV53]
MVLEEKQWELFDFVKERHENQKRKYTGEPYYTHLLRVAEIVSQHSNDEMEIEIALCHDLLENTQCTKQELALKLIDIGYSLFPRSKVLKGVYDLTDHYTSGAYSMYDRKKRKELEAERMCDMQPFSQTVKYAEIIDNAKSIIEHDPEFAPVYLQEVLAYIDDIDEGDPQLYSKCRKVVKSAMEELLLA